MSISKTRNQCAGVEEVQRSRNVVSALIPEVSQPQQRPMGRDYNDQEYRVKHPQRLLPASTAHCKSFSKMGDHALVDGAAGRHKLWLQCKLAESLLILCQVVTK